MPEGQSVHEVEPNKPLAAAVREIFDRRAEHGPRKLIKETYLTKLDDLIKTMPAEQRDTSAIRLQKLLVTIDASLREYGARFTDFVRNVFLWPMVAASKDFPRDKYYQVELARAQAWGNFAANTTKTATAERNAYRDLWLPNALAGAEVAAPVGLFVGATLAGAAKGAGIGAITGPQGALIGAGIGGAIGAGIGAGISLGLKAKDMMMGVPKVYYDLNYFNAGRNATASSAAKNFA